MAEPENQFARTLGLRLVSCLFFCLGWPSLRSGILGGVEQPQIIPFASQMNNLLCLTLSGIQASLIPSLIKHKSPSFR
jgi:hypothetical protein